MSREILLDFGCIFIILKEIPEGYLVGGFVTATGKEATMPEPHLCVVGRQWTLALDKYPQVCQMCKFCGKELRRVALDDLGKRDLNYFLHVIQMHRKSRKEKSGE